MISIIIVMAGDGGAIGHKVGYPHHFLLDEAEWAEIRARFEAADNEAGIVNGDTYRGVPAQFGRHDKVGT